jgi:predicted N-acetyltransferase YhbS
MNDAGDRFQDPMPGPQGMTAAPANYPTSASSSTQQKGPSMALAQRMGACRPDELRELVSLANAVFRGRRTGDMGGEFPLLFSEGNCDHLRVVREDGRMVAHVGICIRDAVILGARLRVASIGAVCTHPDYRGRGLASELMRDAAAHSLEQGAVLMLISGGRGLYHRLGYVSVGRFLVYETGPGAADDAGPDVRLRPMGDDELDVAIGLHQREAVRFLRPREDWQRLLSAGMLMNEPGDLFLAWYEGRPVAYLAVRRGRTQADGTTSPPEVMEFAGCRSSVAGALPQVAGRYGADRAQLVALADDSSLAAHAHARGCRSAPRGFPGTLGILHPERFLAAIRPYLAERLGSDLGRLEFQAGAGGWIIRSGSQALTLETMGQLTAFVFGGDTDEARAVPQAPPAMGGALSAAFPLPLLWYGYNYV